MQLEDMGLSQINQSQRTHRAWSHSCKVPKVVRLTEAGNMMWVPGQGRGGEPMFSLGRSSVWGDEAVLEMDVVSAVQGGLTPPSVLLNMVRVVTFHYSRKRKDMIA